MRVPDWLAARAVTPAGQPYRSDAAAPATLRLPAHAVDGLADGAAGEVGVVDLGADGLAVVCVCSTVNFALRTEVEQEALVASFGRYLHSLSASVQILIRAQRLDLSGQIADLRERAASLPHPALEAAAREHADYLDRLADHADLLRRQVLLVLREPAHVSGAGSASRLSPRLRPSRRSRQALRGVPDDRVRRPAETRLVRRVTETVQLLAPAGIVVTPLEAGQATAVLAAACNPDTLIRPNTAFAAASEVITLTAPDSDLPLDAHADADAAAPDLWGAAPVEATAAVTTTGTGYDASTGVHDSSDDEMWWVR